MHGVKFVQTYIRSLKVIISFGTGSNDATLRINAAYATSVRSHGPSKADGAVGRPAAKCPWQPRQRSLSCTTTTSGTGCHDHALWCLSLLLVSLEARSCHDSTVQAGPTHTEHDCVCVLRNGMARVAKMCRPHLLCNRIHTKITELRNFSVQTLRSRAVAATRVTAVLLLYSVVAMLGTRVPKLDACVAACEVLACQESTRTHPRERGRDDARTSQP